MLIEFTVVRLGWTFSFHFDRLVTQVIFAIGVSMMALALLVYLRPWAIAGVAIALIAGHNILDGIKAEQFGAAAPIWNLLHQPGPVAISPHVVLYVLYPLIPWIGAMAAGYALGPIFRFDRAARMRWLIGLGTAVTAGFIALRASNLYGDPAGWTKHDSRCHRAVLHQLRKISAVLALHRDDHWPVAAAARGTSKHPRPGGGFGHNLWQRAVLLLCCTPLSNPRTRRSVCVGDDR